MVTPRILPFGDRALLAEVDSLAEVLTLHDRLAASRPEGVIDLVPAARTVLVRVEPTRLPLATARAWLAGAVGGAAPSAAPAHRVELPIEYDGDDLTETAALLGFTADELAARHAACEWTVAFTGFAPGFGYLVSPEWRFDIPRRASPRTRVPAGAVGLAGEFSGAYPRDTPGGWQLIGTTPAALFDPDADPPALLQPGTRVRFVPGDPDRPATRHPRGQFAERMPGTRAAVAAASLGPRAAGPGASVGTGAPLAEAADSVGAVEPAGPARGAESAGPAGRAGPAEPARPAGPAEPAGSAGRAASARPAGPAEPVGPAGPAGPAEPAVALIVREPGLLATVQDQGRPGHAAEGIAVSGAADRAALRTANRLVGNAESAAGIEVTMGGLRMVAATDLWFAVTGAWGPIDLAGERVDPYTAHAWPAGSELHLGWFDHGARGYLAVRGGIDAPGAVGSRATDLLAGLGPARLAAGQRLALAADLAGPIPAEVLHPWGPPQHEILELDLAPGPRTDWFADADADAAALFAAEWTVSNQADRVGIRLEGPELRRRRTAELPSEGMVPGALQVPPSGRPVILGPDGPVTGGYPVIAVVTDAGRDALAQARPGTRIRFRHARPVG